MFHFLAYSHSNAIIFLLFYYSHSYKNIRYFLSPHWWSFVSDRINKTTTIERKTMDIEERGVKLRLTVVDTPGELWKRRKQYCRWYSPSNANSEGEKQNMKSHNSLRCHKQNSPKSNTFHRLSRIQVTVEYASLSSYMALFSHFSFEESNLSLFVLL